MEILVTENTFPLFLLFMLWYTYMGVLTSESIKIRPSNLGDAYIKAVWGTGWPFFLILIVAFALARKIRRERGA